MLCNMYLFNAGLNKYEYVKCCIIVANTYGHSVIRVVLVIVYCWGDAAFPGERHAHLPVWCYGACVTCCPKPRMCRPASGRMTVICGCGMSASGHSRGGNSMSRSPAHDTLSELKVTATCHAYTTLSNLCLLSYCEQFQCLVYLTVNWMYFIYYIQCHSSVVMTLYCQDCCVMHFCTFSNMCVCDGFLHLGSGAQ